MKYLTLIIIVSSLFSCASTYHQIFETKFIDNKTLDKELHTFENDSIIIRYSFWEERGVVAFTIYNKLSVPIYIDWKKSSLIFNQEKLNYWADAQITRSSSLYKTYTFIGNSAGNEYISTGNITTNTVKAKLERITFIPPQSYFFVSNFRIKDQYVYQVDTSALKTINSLSNSKKKNYYYIKNFNEKNSPLVFRNFLTVSLTENFNSEFYIDNGFYINQIIELNSNDFRVLKKDSKNRAILDAAGSFDYDYPYKKAINYYSIIPKAYSLEFRKKWNLK